MPPVKKEPETTPIPAPAEITPEELAELRARIESYEAADVQLQPGVTVFVGLNGQGKTNLVEAVHYLAQQRSHRVAKDAPLLRAGHDRAIVAARVRWADREQTVELELNAGRPNRARVGGAPRRPTEAIGVLRTVLFGPEDLALVRGDPGVRRRWCASGPRRSGAGCARRA